MRKFRVICGSPAGAVHEAKFKPDDVLSGPATRVDGKRQTATLLPACQIGDPRGEDDASTAVSVGMKKSPVVARHFAAGNGFAQPFARELGKRLLHRPEFEKAIMTQVGVDSFKCEDFALRKKGREHGLGRCNVCGFNVEPQIDLLGNRNRIEAFSVRDAWMKACGTRDQGFSGLGLSERDIARKAVPRQVAERGAKRDARGRHAELPLALPVTADFAQVFLVNAG